ncbi:hypothetical protein DYB31_012740 [Aphanomyces astaci]|uniref:Uncharacterized protein n=1 Tax=Aphanomyces astaci TaxID=112090 RepID=A0A397EQ85_APHAT|nr:hypothetical protein DYB31_012740 [Aphanomyces astaci]
MVNRLAGLFCAILLTIDVVANDWEIISYVGNGRHFLTPLLDVESVDDMEVDYSFPAMSSPNGVSKIGRFMIDVALAQLIDRTGASYVLSMGSFSINDPSSNLCGSLRQTYPVFGTAISKNNSIHLGKVKDGITYLRGNTLTHLIGSSVTSPVAAPGANDKQLQDLGYVPSRAFADMRITTPLPLPPPGQVTQFNLSMYRFFSTSYCSGCTPYTELGLDMCSVVYSYNDTASTITIASSDNIPGFQHVLGMMFQRTWGTMASLIVRFVCVVMVLGAFGASEKTVRWTEPGDVDSWFKRLIHLVAPAQYRHPSGAFDFAYICFNSDVLVLLYTLAVLFDENIAMLFSRTLYRWHRQGETNVWIELRLMAFSLRWLWLNCLFLKVSKFLCHFVNKSQYTGQNVVMGWLNFSSVTWIYLSYAVLASRNTFIEYGNSVRCDLVSTTQNLDAIFVDFFDSWYIRATGPLLLAIVANLVVILLLDHTWNRAWWRQLASNSLGRQHMFNSTSILCDDDMHFVVRPGYAGTSVEVRARALCTMQWFLSSHVLRFGLQEHPQAVRLVVATKPSPAVTGHQYHNGTRDSDSSVNSRRGSASGRRAKEDTGPTIAVSPMVDEEIRASSESAAAADKASSRDMYLIVQDREGHIRMFDAEKRELQALGLEMKILRDSTFHVA